MRYIPFILVMICISSCIYIQVAYIPKTKETTTSTTSTTLKTFIHSNGTNFTMPTTIIKAECPVNTKTFMRIINQTVNVTRYYDVNLTALQRKQLLNLKAFKCPSGSCGYGYYLCKNDALDIFDIDHPKFSEAPKTDVVIEKLNKTQYLKLTFDNTGHAIINLNDTYWDLIKRIQYIETNYTNNITEWTYYDDTKQNISHVRYGNFSIKHNKTVGYVFREI